MSAGTFIDDALHAHRNHADEIVHAMQQIRGDVAEHRKGFGQHLPRARGLELFHRLRLLNGDGGMIGETGQQAHVPVREITRRAAVHAEGAARLALPIDQRRDQGRHQTQVLHQLGPLHARIGDQIERLGRFARQHG